MAAEQAKARSAADAKLTEALRELKRYKDNRAKATFSIRLLRKKCQNVSDAKEALFVSHYEFAAKTKQDLETEELVEWITPRLDAANDAIDEIFVILEEEEMEQKTIDDTAENNAKLLEDANKLKIARKQCKIDEDLIEEIAAKMNAIISDETKQTAQYGILVQTHIEEIEKILERTSKSWNTLKCLLSASNEEQEVFDKESQIRTR